jgi:hypothetical protein
LLEELPEALEEMLDNGLSEELCFLSNLFKKLSVLFEALSDLIKFLSSSEFLVLEILSFVDVLVLSELGPILTSTFLFELLSKV